MLFPYHLFGVSLPDKITNKKKGGGRLSFSAEFNKIKIFSWMDIKTEQLKN